MRRQACRVDSFCDHSMPEELILFVGGSCELDPAKRPKKLNSRALERRCRAAQIAGQGRCSSLRFGCRV
jgi:hypothetical protein